VFSPRRYDFQEQIIDRKQEMEVLCNSSKEVGGQKKKVPAENTILLCKIYTQLLQILRAKWGQDSIEGIATHYGLDSQGIKSQ
jgi:hypothetical protein